MALSLGDGKSSGGLETSCVVPSHRALESLLFKLKKKKKSSHSCHGLSRLLRLPPACVAHPERLRAGQPEARPAGTACKPGAHSIGRRPCSSQHMLPEGL